MKNSYHRFVDRQHSDDYRQEEIQALKRAIRAKENRLILGIPDIGLSIRNVFASTLLMPAPGTASVDT